MLPPLPSARHAACALTLTCPLAGCLLDVLPEPPAEAPLVCPAEARLGGACGQPDLTCRYGYDPPECGGRTVLCRSGLWVELAHTDARSPSCLGGSRPAPGSGGCPPGPVAPLARPCSDDGLRCKYGYDPVECGGQTVLCRSGLWIELEHTDPRSPRCAPPEAQ